MNSRKEIEISKTKYISYHTKDYSTSTDTNDYITPTNNRISFHTLENKELNHTEGELIVLRMKKTKI